MNITSRLYNTRRTKEMDILQKRIHALKRALAEHVHGLWISEEMAVNILTDLEAATAIASVADDTGSSITG